MTCSETRLIVNTTYNSKREMIIYLNTKKELGATFSTRRSCNTIYFRLLASRGNILRVILQGFYGI